MKKKSVLWILLDLVFLIVFNVVFFVLGGKEHPASVWLSYGFIHFAYIMLLITPLLVRQSKNSAVLSFPIVSISAIYFIVAFIVGVVFIIIHPDSIKIALVVQVIIAGIYAVLLISNMIANEHTADSEEKHELELQYVKTASQKLKGIMDSIEDKKMYKKVEKLYDLLHSSQVKSDFSVKNIELEVFELIDVLGEQIGNNSFDEADNTIKKIEKSAKERNSLLKNMN